MLMYLVIQELQYWINSDKYTIKRIGVVNVLLYEIRKVLLYCVLEGRGFS